MSCTKLGFISSCCKQVKCIYKAFVQIHSGTSLMAPYGRQTNEEDESLHDEEGCCFAFYRHCSLRVRFPCHSLGSTTQLSSRCQYLLFNYNCPEDANTYNSTVLKMPIPTFIELEVQLDTKMKRHCCFFFPQRKMASTSDRKFL